MGNPFKADKFTQNAIDDLRALFNDTDQSVVPEGRPPDRIMRAGNVRNVCHQCGEPTYWDRSQGTMFHTNSGDQRCGGGAPVNR